VGSSGPGSYSLSVFESAYDTLFVTSDAATPATLPYDARTEFGTGCPLPGTCDASAANLSGRWTSTFEGGTPANLVLALADEEGAITGTYVEQGYSGVVAGGVANGAVELRATLQTTTSAGTFCVYRGTLTSACSMSGTYWCSGSSGAWIWFTAYR
jgi:hypothetical protein